MPDRSPKLLRIYLRDFDALLLLAPSVAKRSCKPNRNSPLGDLLNRLRAEFTADHKSFEEVMRLLDVRPSRLKRSVSWTSGIGRMKLNGRLVKYSPLSRVYELQSLEVLVRLKRSMWKALERTYGQRLSSVDISSLVERADRQLADLKPHLKDAADLALKSD